MNKNVDLLLSSFENQPNYLKWLNNHPQKSFFSLKNWPYFHKQFNCHFIFWLHQPALLLGKLSIDVSRSFHMPTGNLYYVFSNTLLIGYLLEIPKSTKLEITPTYISIVRGKVGVDIKDTDELPSLTYFLRDKYLCGYELSTTMVLCSQTDLVDFIT